MESKFRQFAQKVASVFFKKEAPKETKSESRQKYTRLNYFLLTHALEHIQKGSSNTSSPLFTKKILTSKNENLAEMVKHAESARAKQDIHLMSYKQFFLRDELEMKRVIEWKLSKYIKEEEQIRTFIQKMKESSSDNFKRHLITLLSEKEKEVSQEELARELLRQEKNWKLYQSQGGPGPNTVSRI